MSEPDIHLLLQAAAVPRSAPILLLLQRICSKRERDTTESLGFRAILPQLAAKR
jgi:hypothetical protein